MKNIIYTLVILLLLPFVSISQEQKKEKKFGIKFSGFVKNDFFYDTRQTVNAREGHFLLWPAAQNFDENDVDLNARSSFNFLSVQTRLKGTISAPDAFGAKTSGVIEGAFFGHSNGDINGFRLRHAIIKLDWKKSQLLMGQYWHPLFETNCFPGVVSFNTGSGIQPFARNPQVRYTYKAGKVKLYAVAFSERDFTSRGPDPTTGKTIVSSNFIRNSGIPAAHIGMNFKKQCQNTNSVVMGAGVGMLNIQPHTVTANGYMTDALVQSMNYNAFIRFNTQKVTLKLYGVYGGNMANMLMFGGYAVSDTLDAVTGELSWEPINNLALWTDIHSNGKKFQVGLFAGYNMNMGTANEVQGGYHGLAMDLANVMRISPRIMFNSGKFRFATEVEYTSATYGDGSKDVNGIPQNTYNVNNVRLLFATYLFF